MFGIKKRNKQPEEKVKPEYEKDHETAMKLMGEQKFKEAIKYFDLAISKNENHASSWNNKGIAYLSMGQFEKALDCFEKVITITPNDNMAKYNKGFVLYSLERYEEAIKVLAEFSINQPKKDDFYKFGLYMEAKCYIALENYQAAVNTLKLLIKTDKNFKDTKKLLNEVLEKLE